SRGISPFVKFFSGGFTLIGQMEFLFHRHTTDVGNRISNSLWMTKQHLFRQCIKREVSHLDGFTWLQSQFTANRFGTEEHRVDIVPYATHARIQTDQARQLYINAGFFLGLSYSSLSHGLAIFYTATREAPYFEVFSFGKQDFPIFDDCHDYCQNRHLKFSFHFSRVESTCRSWVRRT